MNALYFSRDNATSQYFTAVGTPDGKPHPQNTTRWRVFCHTKVYNSSGPFINDVTHFLRFLTPSSPLSLILQDRLWNNVTFWQIPLPLSG